MTREALRSKPRQERSQEMVSRILDATAQVLAARGYDGLSTNRVAEQAGVSIGSLYRYFEDKEQLVEQLRRRVNDEMLVELTEAMIRSAELEPYDGTRAVLVTLVEGLERNRGVMRALIDGVPMGSQANRLPEVERQLAQFARLGVASRLPGLPRQEVEARLYLALGMTLNACLRIALERPPELDRERLIDLATSMLLAGLGG
jgi:AcrR family transcriptional regulator